MKRVSEELHPEIIINATKRVLNDQGNKSASKVVDIVSNQKLSSLLMKKIKLTESFKMTPEEEFALFVNSKLTVHAYNLIRTNALKLNHDIYPSYRIVSTSYIIKTILNSLYIF